jgi:hypothetical protein
MGGVVDEMGRRRREEECSAASARSPPSTPRTAALSPAVIHPDGHRNREGNDRQGKKEESPFGPILIPKALRVQSRRVARGKKNRSFELLTMECASAHHPYRAARATEDAGGRSRQAPAEGRKAKESRIVKGGATQKVKRGRGAIFAPFPRELAKLARATDPLKAAWQVKRVSFPRAALPDLSPATALGFLLHPRSLPLSMLSLPPRAW